MVILPAKTSAPSSVNNVSRKMRGYFFRKAKTKYFRGDIFLDVETCRRYSCYLLLQPVVVVINDCCCQTMISNLLFKAKQCKTEWTK